MVGQATAAPGVGNELPTTENRNCSSLVCAIAEQVLKIDPLLVVNVKGLFRSVNLMTQFVVNDMHTVSPEGQA